MGEPLQCPGCQQRDAVIAELLRRVAELEATVRDLQGRLGVNAANSSLPPSANPPDAPKPVVKAPTGRRPGGQPGHPPRLRRRLPPDRLAAVVPRLAAGLGYLSGAHHVSRRGLEEIAAAVFDAPLALGTVANLQGPLSAALAPAHAQALAAVRAAPVKHVDETGWKRAGRRC